jgi:tetratricopeptide (TPR) repeat protein
VTKAAFDSVMAGLEDALAYARGDRSRGVAHEVEVAEVGERKDGVPDAGGDRLEQAVAAYRAALEVYTRESLPLDWATTQNNLGNALWTLGEREDGTENLEKAVAAYRAALEVRTRERVPLDWAMTQNNLGTALRALGERQDGASDAGSRRLQEAVAAYRAALEVFRPAGASFYVAGTERNLARAEALLTGRLPAPAAAPR